ncbi:hypothetical protein ACXR5E_003327 [Vibrio mimicus]|nr:putative glycosyltransferase [Vibrio mimicus]
MINKLKTKIIFSISSMFPLIFKVSQVSRYLSRLSFDKSSSDVYRGVISKRSKHGSVSAIYRVKNGSATIEASILSIAPLCSEIIIVDNDSSDKTIEIAERLKKELSDITSIKIFNYNRKLALAGYGYKDKVKKDPDASLAKFYTYCFSLGTRDYVMKCDAHYIFTPRGLINIQKKLLLNPDIVRFRGAEIFGKYIAYEPFIMRNNGSFSFVDGDEYEIIKLRNPVKMMDFYKSTIISPCYMHVKRLSYSKHISKNSSIIIEDVYK